MPTKFDELVFGDLSPEEEEDTVKVPTTKGLSNFEQLTQGDLPSLQQFTDSELERVGRGQIVPQNSDPYGAFFEGLSDSPTLRPLTRPLRIVGEGAQSLITGEEFDKSLLDFGQPTFEPRTPEEQGAFTTGEVAGDAVSFTMGLLGASKMLLSRGIAVAKDAPAAFAAGTARSNRRMLRNKLEAENIAAFVSSKVDQPLAATSLIAAKGSLQRGSAFLDDVGAVMVESAVVNPKAFLTGEAALAGSGVALGIGAGATGEDLEEAEQRALGASIFGGMINVPRLMIGGAKAGSQRFGSIVTSVRGRGRRAEAFAAFKQIAEELGTSADDLLKEIDDAFLRVDNLAKELSPEAGAALREGARNLPVGSLTGNKALIAIERQAARRSLHAKGQDVTDRDTFISNLLTIEDTLRRSGRPRDLEIALGIREQAFDTLLSGRVQKAQTDAIASFEDLLKNNPGATPSELRRRASSNFVGTMREALGEMRTAEKSLYSQIAGDVVVEPPATSTIVLPDGTPASPRGPSIFDNLEARVEQIASGLGEGSRARFLNSENVKNIRGFVENGATVDQLLNARSQLMDDAVTLSSRGQTNASRKATELASGLREVISELDVEGIEVANQFSKQLNDTFTRSFAGDLFEKTSGGSFKIDPELAIGTMLRGGTDRASIRLRDISTATAVADVTATARAGGGRTALREAVETNQQFLDAEITRDDLVNGAIGFDGKFGSSVMDEAELHVRASAADFVKQDGTVDVQGFSRFVRNNEALFEEYPDIRNVLKDPEQAANFLERAKDNATRLSTQRMRRRLFGGLIGAKNPAPVMGQIIQSPTRGATIKSLANMAKKIGRQENTPEYMDGLKSTILTAVYDNTRRGDNFRWAKYNEALTAPVDSKNTDSLLDLMVDNQILSSVEKDRILDMVNVGIRVERALTDPTNIDDILDEGRVSAIVEATASIIGSAAASGAASRAGVTGGAGSIVIPATGAKLAKKFFVRDRVEQVNDIIIEAAGNSGAFRTLMEEFDTGNVAKHELLWKQLDSFLISAGLHKTGGLGDFDQEVLELPEMPEPLEGEEEPLPVDEPDFFEQFRGEL